MIDHNNIHERHYKGAVNELKAMNYYLGKGCQVYTPICQQGVVDFIVDSGTDLAKVQVKTATWVKSGNHKYLQCRTRLTNKYQSRKPYELYDILFIIYENKYWEIPSYSIKSSNISLENTGENKVQWDIYKIS